MRKHLLFTLLAFASTMVYAARDTYHVDVKRHVSASVSEPTCARANVAYLAGRFGYFDADKMSITADGDNQLIAEVWGTDDVFTTFTYGKGHWFHADGAPASRAGDRDRVVAVELNVSEACFQVVHRPNTGTTEYVKVGDEFRFAELAVHGTDTVRYEFHVTIVGDNVEETSTTDQYKYDFFHRADQGDGMGFTTLFQRNDEDFLRQNWIQVNAGDRITIDADVTDDSPYDSVWVQWNDKEGNRVRSYASGPYVITENATTDLSGQYTMSVRAYRKSGGRVVKNYIVYIDVQDHYGESLSWEGVLPTFSYNFKDEYGEIPQPQNILGDVGETDRYGKKVNRVNGEWWTAVWGSDLNSEVGTDTATVNQAARNMVKKYDTDFAYIRDVMGWPPDIRARKGYKSTVYIFGSGLRKDNASKDEKGGYQSAIWYSDPNTGLAINWPCVWASYYPFSRFRDDADKKWSDGDYQREAMIHEGIHGLFADLEGAKNSAWFQEAGNTWLQSAMAAKRSGSYGTPGFLDGCPFIAPFMPIECYSGWLQDGSFGGPSAEGVNMYNGSQQICTWRTWLGGTQYGNAFPIILGHMCGEGSIPWIWRYCRNRVLEGIGDSIGDDAMRKLIVQYRARQAAFDFGPWSTGYRQATSDHFGMVIGPEWEPYWINCEPWQTTCYQRLRVNDEKGWLAPEELTLPGWSGANIIPIHVDLTKDKVCVQFRPEDTNERAILCYKTKAGKAYYSQMVYCGDMELDITDAPANGIIFCVVVNTDYRFTGDEQRKHKWDYRIRLREGAKGIANQHKRWFLNEQTITDDDWTDLTPVEDIIDDENSDEYLENHLRLLTGMAMAGGEIRVDVQGINPTEVAVHMVGLQGIVADEAHLTPAGTYRLPSNLRHGLYVLAFEYRGQKLVYKVIVK